MKIILIDYSDGTKTYQHVHSKRELEQALKTLKSDSSVEYLEVLFQCKSYDFWSNPNCSPETDF